MEPLAVSEAVHPEIYRDRMPFSELMSVSPSTLDMLEARGLGKFGRNETVQFCGLALGGRVGSAVFLPRQCKELNSDQNLETARLTMKVLARYGAETPTRLGVEHEKVGSPSLIATISELGGDFRQFGLFIERQRHKSRDSGKPDWKRTVSREVPFRGNGSSVVYGSFHSTLSRDSRTNDLAQIQAFVLREIIQRHSWWIDGIQSRQSELHQVSSPNTSLMGMLQKLRALRTEVYATRPLRLIENLSSYLSLSSELPSDGTLLGVEDFHTVWEHMLRKTYSNVEDSWNSRLPVAHYVTAEGGQRHSLESGMKTDIVVRNDRHLTILDAKYYDASSVKNVPLWSDIVKQMYYEIAVKTIIESDETVSNCFVFPAKGNSEGRYVSVQVVDRETEGSLLNFPEIRCIYRDVRQVMTDFVSGHTKEFSRL